MDVGLVATVAGSIAAVVAIPIAAWQLRLAMRDQKGRRTAASTPEQVDAAARRLAELVEQQWREEVRIRLLQDPAPLTVRWKPADLELGDHRRLAGTLFGGTNDIAHLVGAFRRLPQKRLVILGGPGAGKTTLAVLLTLALCDRPSSREPVPLLLAPGSWNPTSESLHTWISRRLAEDYPALQASAFGQTAVADLVSGQRVLPVLDGLDELSDGTAHDALLGIQSALAHGDSLILTCRTEEYRSIVAASDIVTAAAVVEPEIVRPHDVAEYLTNVVPPFRLELWRPLLDHIRTHRHNDPLVTALTSPLMVSLLRVVYADAATNPIELVSPSRFPDRASIENHLLSGLVPTLMARLRLDRNQRSTTAWDPNESQRWLSFLATHLNQLGTRDLRWWHVYKHATVIVWSVVFGIGGGLGTTLAVGLAYGFVSALQVGPVYGSILGLGVGLAFGLAIGLVSGLGVCLEAGYPS